MLYSTHQKETRNGDQDAIKENTGMEIRRGGK